MIDWYRSLGFWPKLYCLWAGFSISLAISVAGFSSESITRLLVVAFLLAQFFFRSRMAKSFPGLAPKKRFIVLGTLLAVVVEGFHMISKPVFLAVKIERVTSLTHGFINFAVDLLFTLPAYLVIFSVIWYFINRYQYNLWTYIVVMGLAQALGDGGIFFFLGAPPMFFFLPYPMTNYHAINIIPFLAIRDQLPQNRSTSVFAYFAVPGLMATYFVCGAIIKILGKLWGLE